MSSNSILTSTKKVLGIDEDYTAFDLDILTHINSVFATLNQLGIGPEEGFYIEDDEATWTDLFGSEPRLNSIRTYVYLKVRLLFDPPGTSYMIESLRKQAEEFEWRLNLAQEGINTVPEDENEDLFY